MRKARSPKFWCGLSFIKIAQCSIELSGGCVHGLLVFWKCCFPHVSVFARLFALFYPAPVVAGCRSFVLCSHYIPCVFSSCVFFCQMSCHVCSVPLSQMPSALLLCALHLMSSLNICCTSYPICSFAFFFSFLPCWMFECKNKTTWTQQITALFCHEQFMPPVTCWVTVCHHHWFSDSDNLHLFHARQIRAAFYQWNKNIWEITLPVSIC